MKFLSPLDQKLFTSETPPYKAPPTVGGIYAAAHDAIAKQTSAQADIVRHLTGGTKRRRKRGSRRRRGGGLPFTMPHFVASAPGAQHTPEDITRNILQVHQQGRAAAVGDKGLGAAVSVDPNSLSLTGAGRKRRRSKKVR